MEKDKKILRSVGQHVGLVTFYPHLLWRWSLLHTAPLGGCLCNAVAGLSPQPAATAGEAHGIHTQAG